MKLKMADIVDYYIPSTLPRSLFQVYWPLRKITSQSTAASSVVRGDVSNFVVFLGLPLTPGWYQIPINFELIVSPKFHDFAMLKIHQPTIQVISRKG